MLLAVDWENGLFILIFNFAKWYSKIEIKKTGSEAIVPSKRLLLSYCCAVGLQVYGYQKPCHPRFNERSFGHRLFHGVADIFVDAISLHMNLLSRNTAQVITGFLPLYLITRRMDDDIHGNFYDPHTHTNCDQFPKKCHKMAQKAVAIPMVTLSSMMFFGWNEDVRQTGRMTAISLPFVHSGKNVIKRWRSKACLRPWHEDFSCEERSSGGFPSGHMANVSFMTTLWGLRHGPRWAVPLGLFSTFVLADFINWNRHYLSQMVAGVGLGVIYALAANKVIDCRLNRICENLSFGVEPNGCGIPTTRICYRF